MINKTIKNKLYNWVKVFKGIKTQETNNTCEVLKHEKPGY